MIIHTSGMKQIEADSGIPVEELMESAGAACAAAIRQKVSADERILVLMGSGNNGGDGAVITRLLKDDFSISAVLVSGQPKTEAAKTAFKKVPRSRRTAFKNIEQAIAEADVIIDTVYGFG